MPGLRIDAHLFPEGLNGGHMMYPTSGVSHGVKVTFGSPAVKAATTGTAVVNISAGKLTLDGQIIEMPALTGVEVVTGLDLTSATPQTFGLYIVPTRICPASTTPPSSPTTGDCYVKVSGNLVQGYYKYNGTTWDKLNLIEMPQDWKSQMGLPLNRVVPTVTAANISIAPETTLYNSGQLAIQLPNQGDTLARQDASIKIATISYTSSVGTVVSSYIKQDMINL